MIEFIKKNLSLIVVIIALVLIAWLLGLRSLLNNLEMMNYDWRAQIATDKGPVHTKFSPASKDIVLLSVDDFTEQRLKQHPELGIGRWPWPRKNWGDVINFIAQGKPKAIVFDIRFPGSEGNSKENIESDNYFAKMLKKNKDTNIIQAVSLDRPSLDLSKDANLLKLNKLDNRLTAQVDDKSIIESAAKDSQAANLLGKITFWDRTSMLPTFLENSKLIGVCNLAPGENGIARYNMPLYRLLYSDKAYLYVPYLSLATLLTVLPDNEKTPFKFEKDRIILGKRIIPVDEEGRVLINWHGKSKTYTNISASQVVLTDALNRGAISKIDKKDLISSSFFKDKIVVIGQTSAGSDFHPTSMEMIYPGPEIIATTIDNYLNDTQVTNPKARKFISKAPLIVDLLVLLIFCFAIGFFNIRSRSIFYTVCFFILMMILFFLFSVFMFSYPSIRLWINMSYPIMFMTFTAIGTYVYKIYAEDQEKKAVEGLFGKFVSPQVLDKLLSDPKGITRGGQRKIMTVMFSDIRGFTTLSESTPVQQLIPQLNEYLSEMVEVVLKYNGTFDKYIGDAVMAFFGDPLPMEDHALRAVLTAIDMYKKLEELNEKWKTEGRPVLDIGIGINTGEMVVGHIGSHRLLDYTVIGDNVNLGSRLEGLNKQYKTHIIISEATYKEVEQYIDAIYLDECRVKGKVNAIRVYEVKGIKEGIELPSGLIQEK